MGKSKDKKPSIATLLLSQVGQKKTESCLVICNSSEGGSGENANDFIEWANDVFNSQAIQVESYDQLLNIGKNKICNSVIIINMIAITKTMTMTDFKTKDTFEKIIELISINPVNTQEIIASQEIFKLLIQRRHHNNFVMIITPERYRLSQSVLACISYTYFKNALYENS